MCWRSPSAVDAVEDQGVPLSLEGQSHVRQQAIAICGFAVHIQHIPRVLPQLAAGVVPERDQQAGATVVSVHMQCGATLIDHNACKWGVFA